MKSKLPLFVDSCSDLCFCDLLSMVVSTCPVCNTYATTHQFSVRQSLCTKVRSCCPAGPSRTGDHEPLCAGASTCHLKNRWQSRKINGGQRSKVMGLGVAVSLSAKHCTSFAVVYKVWDTVAEVNKCHNVPEK